MKILIIGSAGAGKTVLAVELGSLLDLPVIHLDAVHWRPDWVKPPAEEWRQTVDDLLQRERWIMDGNYGGTLPQRLAACDTVLFLALPRRLCLYRVLKRTITHWGRTRPDLNPGCREQLPDWEFLSWIWTYHRKRTPGILEMLREIEAHKRVVILKSRSEVARFVQSLRNTSEAATA